ncbi:MAG: HNH endonuclease [Bdellovibrionales bacterium]
MTGRRCESSHQLEADHIVPRALGGRDDISNLRCLCRSHKRFAAEEKLGKTRANRWRRLHEQREREEGRTDLA